MFNVYLFLVGKQTKTGRTVKSVEKVSEVTVLDCCYAKEISMIIQEGLEKQRLVMSSTKKREKFNRNCQKQPKAGTDRMTEYGRLL